MKEIKTYQELVKAQENIQKTIVKCPYFVEMRVDYDGYFVSDKEIFLEPNEALKLGEFLVAFYGNKVEKT